MYSEKRVFGNRSSLLAPLYLCMRVAGSRRYGTVSFSFIYDKGFFMKRSNNRDWTLETLLVHGYEREREEGSGSRKGVPTVQPIYTSTTYLHYDAETLDRAFDNSLSGEKGETAFVYARQGNPNAYALETVMTQAEGGVGAIAFGSGMAAIHAALLTAGLVAGSKILAAKDLYGATTSLLRQAFVPLGVEVVTHDLYGRDVDDPPAPS